MPRALMPGRRQTPETSYKDWLQELEERGVREGLAEAVKVHGATLREVWSPSRLPHVSRAREECFAWLRDRFPGTGTTTFIAVVMLCHHGTVLKGLRRRDRAKGEVVP